MRHRRALGTRVRLAALATTVLIAAAACSSDPGPEGAAALPVADVSTSVPGWGDDHTHVIVFTAAALARTPLPGVTVGDDGVDLASAPPVPVAAPDDGTFEVHRADGTVERVVVPDESLTVVAPTSSDRDALAAAGEGALLVVDRDGAIGPAGTRYVLLGIVLTEVTTASQPATTEPVTTEPATTEPATTEPATTESATTEPVDDDTLVDAVDAVDGVVRVERLAPGVLAVATDGDPADIEAVPGVAFVQEDVLVGLFDDPRQGEEWYIDNTGAASQAGGYAGVAGADLGATEAWAVSEGAGVVVAVIDSGVDIDHTDLTGRIWSNSDEVCNNGADDDHNGYVDDCRGWDFGMNDASPRPDAGVTSSDHGTHVAGIVAAGRNGVGVVGVAPAATVMALKVMSSNGAMSTGSIYSALLYAADNGAQVVNMSLGTNPGAYTRAQMSTFEAGIAYARSHGVTVVVAAGNSSVDTTSAAVWPAEFSRYYDNQITVSASTNSDTRASFSNWGAATTVWAPGWFLLSTLPGGAWGWKSGTSMASPAVAGVVAAVLSAGQVATPSAVRQRLVDTSVSVAAGPRVDMASAVGARQPASVSVSVAGADAVLSDQAGRLGFSVAATGAPAAAAGVRVSLAAAVGSSVYAVSGVEASFSDAGGEWATVATGTDGAFPVQPIRDASALAASGWQFDTDLALPSGDYAVIVELVDDAGLRLGKAKVSYLTVADTPPPPEGSAPATTAPGTTAPGTTAPGTTAPATTAPGAPATTAPTSGTAPATTAPSAGTAPATTAPSGGSGGGSGGGSATTSPTPATTAPSGSPATTAAPGAPATTTAPGATTAPPATSPRTTAAPAPTTAPAPGAPATTAPATTAPATTTPAPGPDRDGDWIVTSMNPRLATTDGGAWATIDGTFPTAVPVYVWFGDLGIVEAVSFGGSLLLQTPTVLSAGVTDVVVRFHTDHDVQLTLERAFTFVAPASGDPGAPPATTTPASGGGSPGGGGTPTTTPSATPTTAPANGGGGGGGPATTSPPAGTQPPSGSPGTTAPAPATSAPATPGPATTAPSGTAPATTVATGGVHLQPRPASGVLAVLQVSTWPRPGCRSATCPAADLP